MISPSGCRPAGLSVYQLPAQLGSITADMTALVKIPTDMTASVKIPTDTASVKIPTDMTASIRMTTDIVSQSAFGKSVVVIKKRSGASL